MVRTQASREIEIDITIPGNEPSVGRVLKCPGGKKRKRDCPADNKAGLYFTCMEQSTYFTNMGTSVTFIESSWLDFV